MKNFLLAAIVFFFVTTKAQVTLEHTYPFFEKQFFVTDIGDNDYKYVIQDTSGFSIYNLDHTPYLLNYTTPIPLSQPPSYYQIAYITKSLFDCDSSNVEYVITAPSYPGNFYIYRIDGTLLFNRDSVKGPYCIGCNAGSIWTQPIFNTPSGSKLLLFSDSQGSIDSISVYSLCGKLPTRIKNTSFEENFIKVFPNPTSGMVNFEITPPNNYEKFKLTIYDSQIQVIEETDVFGKNYQLDLSRRSLSTGVYFFDLRTNDNVFQTGKFIISR